MKISIQKETKHKVGAGTLIITENNEILLVVYDIPHDEYHIIDLTHNHHVDSWDKSDWIQIGSDINGDYIVREIIDPSNAELIIR